MQEKTLEAAFNAVFHDPIVFSDFLNLDVEQEVTVSTYKDREVYKASDKLKKILRFINKVLLKRLQSNTDVVHSYIKGKSPLTAVSAHSKSKYFFNTDIENFFSNITINDVETIFRRDNTFIPISDLDNFIETLVKTVTFKGFIPAGFPTSPQISNSFLLRFDDRLKDFCDQNDLVYTRYSDDIIISSNSLEKLANLEETILRLLKKYASKELNLNTSKTRYTHLGNKVKILGLIITPAGKVTIDSKYKKLLESLIHFYINDKERFNDLLDKSLAGKEHSLFGLLHYAKSIDEQYLLKLQKKYGAYTLNELMKDKWSD